MVGRRADQSWPRRERRVTRPSSRRAMMRYPSSLISCSHPSPIGAASTSVASSGSTKDGSALARDTAFFDATRAAAFLGAPRVAAFFDATRAAAFLGAARVAAFFGATRADAFFDVMRAGFVRGAADRSSTSRPLITLSGRAAAMSAASPERASASVALKNSHAARVLPLPDVRTR